MCYNNQQTKRPLLFTTQTTNIFQEIVNQYCPYKFDGIFSQSYNNLNGVCKPLMALTLICVQLPENRVDNTSTHAVCFKMSHASVIRLSLKNSQR